MGRSPPHHVPSPTSFEFSDGPDLELVENLMASQKRANEDTQEEYRKRVKHAHDTETQELRNRIEQLEQLVADANLRLTEEEARHEQLRLADVNKANEDHKTLVKRFNALNMQIKDNTNEHKQQREKIIRIEEDLAQKVRDAEVLSKEVERVNTQMEARIQEVAVLEANQDERDMRIERLTAAKSEVEKGFDAQKQEMTTKDDQLRTLRESRRADWYATDELHMRLDLAKQESSCFQKETELQDAEIHEVRSRYCEELDMCQGISQQQQYTIDRLTQQLTASNTRFNTVQGENTKLQKAITSQGTLDHIISTLRSQLDSKNQTIQRLQQGQREADEHVTELHEEEVSTLKAEIASRDGTIAALCLKLGATGTTDVSLRISQRPSSCGMYTDRVQQSHVQQQHRSSGPDVSPRYAATSSCSYLQDAALDYDDTQSDRGGVEEYDAEEHDIPTLGFSSRESSLDQEGHSPVLRSPLDEFLAGPPFSARNAVAHRPDTSRTLAPDGHDSDDDMLYAVGEGAVSSVHLQAEEPDIDHNTGSPPPDDGQEEDVDEAQLIRLPMRLMAYTGIDKNGEECFQPLNDLSSSVLDILAQQLVSWEDLASDTKKHPKWADCTFRQALDAALRTPKQCLEAKMRNSGGCRWTKEARFFEACLACANNSRLCIKAHGDEYWLLPLPIELRGSAGPEASGF